MEDQQATTEESLRRVFLEGFTARDLAEPLASFDIIADTSVVHDYMEIRPLRVVGLRNQGLITSFVEQDNIDNRPLIEQAIPLAEASMLTYSSPFQEIVGRLNERRFLLVAALGQPFGVISRNDLQKAPMRMWLFGIVTLFEMKVTRVVRDFFPNESWRAFVSDSRIQKAEQLQAERQRRNQSVELMDCLQLGDKGQLFARTPELRQRYWDRSRRLIEGVIKELERLRNNLAHSQDIVSENWDAIVMLAEALEALFDSPGGLSPTSSLDPQVTESAPPSHADDA